MIKIFLVKSTFLNFQNLDNVVPLTKSQANSTWIRHPQGSAKRSRFFRARSKMLGHTSKFSSGLDPIQRHLKTLLGREFSKPCKE